MPEGQTFSATGEKIYTNIYSLSKRKGEKNRKKIT
jgi:hypothetical protein